MNATGLLHLRERVIERLHRPPAPMQEIWPARQEVAPRGHARHRADIGGVEARGSLCQPREIRHLHPVAPIGRQEVSVQRVKGDDDGFQANWDQPQGGRYSSVSAVVTVRWPGVGRTGVGWIRGSGSPAAAMRRNRRSRKTAQVAA